MRSFHVSRIGGRLLAIIFVFGFLGISSQVFAGNTPPPRLTKQTRDEIMHAFDEELVYVRTSFPMGKTGLRIKNGVVSPNGVELQHLMALWGPATKPGDRARISDVIIKDDHIRFEINGGPIKKQKWYQHIQISGSASSTPVAPGDSQANARGSFVDLYFDKYVPEMTGPQLKEFLYPVFDFDAKSALDAYLETVSPAVKAAIQNHHVLVGMNREMVIYAKGRPPRKIRENMEKPATDGDDPEQVGFEEWIYGAPPQDVDFVRFIGDEVIRVETMKVDGQKIVRVDKEVDLGAPTVAKKQDDLRPATAPTLRRPGEEMPDSDPENPSHTQPIGAPVPPPSGSPPGPNFSGGM